MSEVRAETAAAPSRPVRRPSTDATTATVTVACDLPCGHILQIYHTEEVEHTLPNGRVITENNSTLDLQAGQFALHGSAIDLGAVAGGSLPDFRMIKGDTPGAGYGLTTGIPRSFWERWLEQNKQSPLVTGRHIYAAGTESRAASEAKDYREFKSGFQGLNPAGDYRVPSGRGIRKYNPSDNRVTPEQSSEVGTEE